MCPEVSLSASSQSPLGASYDAEVPKGRGVGIAVATFNSGDVIEGCLEGFEAAGFTVVLLDDASSDDTVERARGVCPGVHVLRGSGELWWGGGTRAATERCLALGCEHVVMLNPDVWVSAEGILRLVEFTVEHPRSIAAALVVQRGDEGRIAWGGSTFGPILKGLPIFSARYIQKRGAAVSVGVAPYRTDEVHGRAVAFSRETLAVVGMIDDQTFPHYGADNDFSMRAQAKGVEMWILPEVRASLDVGNTGMPSFRAMGARERLENLRGYLLDRKKGDALRVYWRLYQRHLPLYQALPSYAFAISLNILRRLR